MGDTAATIVGAVGDLDPVNMAIFGTAGAVIVAAELYGVFHKRDKGDTISELWWWAMRRWRWAKVPASGALGAGLLWLFVHLVWGGS